ncbi:hypothetical protein Hypma_000159 [Hypsizygus marmoreus]|uniref:AC transposase n=1 Tax=Hypsizygus marmoreus TaxID=39966 RepID=A0A369KAQ6_HYPMA|nr:hypothetical protein Hypma_000159 [Hypsizygus marmoreus]
MPSGSQPCKCSHREASSPDPPPTNTSPDNSRPLSPEPQVLTRLEKFNRQFKVKSMSDEDVLVAQKLTWTSDVYGHFFAPTITHDGDTVQYNFKCKNSLSIIVSCACHDESTSNLKQHIACCEPGNSSEARAMMAFIQGSTYSPSKHRMKITLWVAWRHHPFQIVEDSKLLNIFYDLNNKVVTPSRFTVSCDVKEIFELSCSKVVKMLQVRDGKMISIILDFIKASKAHTGHYLAGHIAECIHEYGIQKKIMALTLDNASNNLTLTNELQVLIPSFHGQKTRVRCLAHILNLMVKAILSQFSKKGKATDDGDEDDVTDTDEDEGYDFRAARLIDNDDITDDQE